MRAAALGAVHGLTGSVHINAVDLRFALTAGAIAPATGFIAATATAVALLFDQSAHSQRNDDYDDQQNDCCSCIHGVLFSLNDAMCRSVFQAQMLALANITLKLELSQNGIWKRTFIKRRGAPPNGDAPLSAPTLLRRGQCREQPSANCTHAHPRMATLRPIQHHGKLPERPRPLRRNTHERTCLCH